MIAEAPRAVNTAKYYSFRPPQAGGFSPEIGERLANTDPVASLAERSLKAFDKPIEGRKLRVVHKGTEPFSPMDTVRHFALDVSGEPVVEVPKKEVKKSQSGQLIDSKERPVKEVKERDVFLAQAKQVVTHYAHDLIDQDGQVKSGSERVWSNLTELTPKLVEILVSHGGYGDTVEKTHSLNILAAALQMVRDPQTSLALKVGIGGSDSPFTSARFLAYGVPALNTVKEIHDLYEERKKRVLTAAVVAKTESPENKSQVRTETTQLIKAQGVAALVSEGQLTKAEFDQALNEYAILETPPTVQFICTPEAAIYANFQGKESAVRERTQDQISSLRTFVGEYYQDIAPQVQYLTDLPWDQHSPQTREVIKFFAHQISSHPDSVSFVSSLRESGLTHGGEVGANRAVEYIAMHRTAFQDNQGEIPNPEYLLYPDQSAKEIADADISFTSGCKSETRFNALRVVMAEASITDLQNYLERELSDSSDLDGILLWLRTEKTKREEDLLDPKRPFRAKLDIHAIHTISGYKPPYYPVPGIDIPVSSLPTLKDHIEELPAIAEGVELSNGNGPLDSRARRTAILALTRDYHALGKVVGVESH